MMNANGFILSNNLKVVKGQDSPETVLSAADYPASGSYVDVRGIERFHVIIHLGAINAGDTPVFKVQQAEAANGTLKTISATYAEHTATATDDDEFVTFTVETDKLDHTNDYNWVSVDVSGVANASYAEIFFLLEEGSLPVTQTTAVLPTASQYNFTG